jgi:hypothetical protein
LPDWFCAVKLGTKRTNFFAAGNVARMMDRDARFFSAAAALFPLSAAIGCWQRRDLT